MKVPETFCKFASFGENFKKLPTSLLRNKLDLVHSSRMQSGHTTFYAFSFAFWLCLVMKTCKKNATISIII